MGTRYAELAAAHDARRDPDRLSELDGCVLLVGPAAPTELALAIDAHPIRLLADPHAGTPLVDERMGELPIGWRGRSYLEQLLGLRGTPLAIVFAGGAQDDVHTFASLRELVRLGEAEIAPCHFLDLPGLPTPTSAHYRRRRVENALSWLARTTSRHIDEHRLADAVALVDTQRSLLATLARHRTGDVPPLTGAAAHVVRQAGTVLHPREHTELLAALIDEGFASAPTPRPAETRLVLAGSPQEDTSVCAVLEEHGVVVLGAHEHGDPAPTAEDDAGDGRDPVAIIADRVLTGWTRSADPDGTAVSAVVDAARDVGASVLVHVAWDGDDPQRWDGPRVAARAPSEMTIVRVDGPAGAPSIDLVRQRLRDALGSAGADQTVASAPSPGAGGTVTVASPGGSGGGSPPSPVRTRKVLAAADEFSAYQRTWFGEVAERARAGEPFAVVSADYPHELLRAMDIPYVVNQWWASIVAAKRLAPRHAAALLEHDYATDVEPYSTQGLASFLTPTAEQPWGGLPTPTILGATLGTAPTHRIYTAWARESGAAYLPIERSAETRWELPIEWWDELPHHWDQVLEPERLDLMRAELLGVIRGLEAVTGRRFDVDALGAVLQRANEQAAAYREARDTLAASRPVVAGVVDTMPATMVPQWHRGSTWGRDAADRFRAEVVARARRGQGALAGPEHIRLSWVGRGLWTDMSFYQELEDSHGAVFVWSMYLGLAADGYLRWMDEGQDPLRALASRFLTMGDELRMPTWAGAWHVKEARAHGVHGAVAIADADPFVLRALEHAGIPVLRLPMDNMAAGGSGDARRHLRRFVEELAGRTDPSGQEVPA